MSRKSPTLGLRFPVPAWSLPGLWHQASWLPWVHFYSTPRLIWPLFPHLGNYIGSEVPSSFKIQHINISVNLVYINVYLLAAQLSLTNNMSELSLCCPIKYKTPSYIWISDKPQMLFSVWVVLSNIWDKYLGPLTDLIILTICFLSSRYSKTFAETV